MAEPPPSPPRRLSDACDLYVVCCRCADDFHPCCYDDDDCGARVAIDKLMVCRCAVPKPDMGDTDWDKLQVACPRCEHPADYPNRDGEVPATILDLALIAAAETGGHCYRCKRLVVPEVDGDDMDWTLVTAGTTVLFRKTNSCVHTMWWLDRCSTCGLYVHETGTACCSSNYPVPRVHPPAESSQPVITAFITRSAGRAVPTRTV